MFEDAIEVSLVCPKNGTPKEMDHVEFKTGADVNKDLERRWRTEIDGQALILDYIMKRRQGQENLRSGKNDS